MAKKNKHGLYVSKAGKKEKIKIDINGLGEVPRAYRKINKKDKHNADVLSKRRDIKWQDN